MSARDQDRLECHHTDSGWQATFKIHANEWRIEDAGAGSQCGANLLAVHDPTRRCDSRDRESVE